MKKLETGLSGCTLELIDSNTLRKHSSSESYNKRLDLQVKKQQLFSTQVYRNIETPKVLSKENGYFDMDAPLDDFPAFPLNAIIND